MNKIISISRSDNLAPSRNTRSTSRLKRFGKKRYAIVALIVVLVIITAAILVPSGAARIPLQVHLTNGEKLIYHSIEKITSQEYNATTSQLEKDAKPRNNTIEFTEVSEVIDEDNQSYTLNYTHTVGQNPLNLYSTFSYIEKMSKTGFSTRFYSRANYESNSSGPNNPIVSALLAKPEVTVGDIWTIPTISSGTHSNMTGNLTLHFVDIQEITVLAGTFKVVKVEFYSRDTIRTLSTPQSNSVSTIYGNFSGVSYIEFDTGKEIERITHDTSIVQTYFSVNSTDPLSEQESSNKNIFSMFNDITVHRQLIDDVMPGEEPSKRHYEERTETTFLKDVIGLDLDHYDVWPGSMDPTGFVKYTLISQDNTLTALLKVNENKVVWYKLTVIEGEPNFSNSTDDNIEAAQNLLERYQTCLPDDDIQIWQNMLDSYTGINTTQDTFTTKTTSPTGEEIILELRINSDDYYFTWKQITDEKQIDLLNIQLRESRCYSFSSG